MSDAKVLLALDLIRRRFVEVKAENERQKGVLRKIEDHGMQLHRGDCEECKQKRDLAAKALNPDNWNSSEVRDE